MEYKVYLAGPISGLSYEDATNWRTITKDAMASMSDNQVIGFSPMRGKLKLESEKEIQDSYPDYALTSINGINTRDYNDVKTSHVILVNFLGCGSKVSIGTAMEIAWARVFQIPVVIVMEKNNIHRHGMLTFGNIVVETLTDGIETVIEILLP